MIDFNRTVFLDTIEPADLPRLRKWRNLPAIRRWCRQNDLIDGLAQSAWFERQAQDNSTRMYLICTGEERVGVCGLTSIDYMNRRAEFSLYIAPEYQRIGCARAALGTLLDHGFRNLGLNLIWGEVFDGNPALELFDGLGFRRDGVRRQFYYRDGSFINAHLISITVSEWLSSAQASLRAS